MPSPHCQHAQSCFFSHTLHNPSHTYTSSNTFSGNGPIPFVLDLVDTVEEQKVLQSKARGRIMTDSWLRVLGADGVYSIGDCATMDESPLPGQINPLSCCDMIFLIYIHIHTHTHTYIHTHTLPLRCHKTFVMPSHFHQYASVQVPLNIPTRSQ